MTADAMLPCPFCGSTPHIQFGKLNHCQLHGDPYQAIKLCCANKECPTRPSLEAGDIHNGGKEKALAEAIVKWNTRPTPQTPVDVRIRIAAALERLCQQLPDGANCTAAAHILREFDHLAPDERCLPELPEGWDISEISQYNYTDPRKWTCLLHGGKLGFLGNYKTIKGEGRSLRACVLAAISKIDGGKG